MHNSIDKDITKEKNRSKCTHKVFILIDIALILLIPGVEAYLWHLSSQAKSHSDETHIVLIIILYEPALETLFLLILVASAFYIARRVENSSGKKQNTCLLTWHALNLTVQFVLLIPSAIYYPKWRNAVPYSNEYNEYGYY